MNQLFSNEGLQYTYFCNFSVERPRPIIYQFPFAVRNLLPNFCEFWERATFIHFGWKCHVRICSFPRLVHNSASILHKLHETIIFNQFLNFNCLSTVFDLFFCKEFWNSCFFGCYEDCYEFLVFYFRTFFLKMFQSAKNTLKKPKSVSLKTYVAVMKFFDNRCRRLISANGPVLSFSILFRPLCIRQN